MALHVIANSDILPLRLSVPAKQKKKLLQAGCRCKENQGTKSNFEENRFDLFHIGVHLLNNTDCCLS